MEPSPSSARRRLGAELRAVRESVRMTLEDGAAGIQRSSATLSRLENGKSTPRLSDIRALLDHYLERDPEAVPDALRTRIFELARIGFTEGWFAAYRDVLSGDMTYDDIRRYVEFESDASVICSYEPDLVPGLLQTRSYSEALARIFFPEHSAIRHRRLVDFRMARQRVLRRNGGRLVLDVVIGEAALNHRVASADVMREQLRFLREVLTDATSGVRIRVAPITCGVRAALGGPFVIMDFPEQDESGLVYLESLAGAQYVQTVTDYQLFRHQFEELRSVALGERDSCVLLDDLIRRLR